jgi:phosphotransferase system enzyme I (PtsI)
VLRLMQSVVEAAHRNHIWVGVCGEVASDVVLMPALIGLEVDELSASAASIPRIKRAIQALNYEQSRLLVQRCMQNETGEENHREFLSMAQQLYPEIL